MSIISFLKVQLKWQLLIEALLIINSNNVLPTWLYRLLLKILLLQQYILYWSYLHVCFPISLNTLGTRAGRQQVLDVKLR